MIYSLLLNANLQELTSPAYHIREAASLADSLLMRVSRLYPGGDGDPKAPQFYIPYRGLRTPAPKLLTGRQVRTRWIGENAYELEALRLLALTGRGREPVEYMLTVTDKRLRLAGAPHPDLSFETSIFTLSALRFWSAQRPMDWALQDKLLSALEKHIDSEGNIVGMDCPPFYLWLTLATTPNERAQKLLCCFSRRLATLDELPWPNEPDQRFRRAIIAKANKVCACAALAKNG